MIVMRGVERRFGRGRRATWAVRGVSAEVDAGAVVAVVGPNGAGKSTFLGLVLGFLAPTAGAVEIEGMDPRRWVRSNGVGWLPDRFELPAEWRAGDVLRSFARLDGAPDPGGAAAAALERFGLERHEAKTAGRLSRGLVQRLGLAQALLARHRLVVLDEPGQGLDPVWRIRLRDVIAGLKREGVTVLLASHDLAEVERVADRVLVLDGGRLVDVVDLGAGEASASWALTIEARADQIAAVFPGALQDPGGSAWVVEAADAADLSARLAALLAEGAVVERVVPATQELEARVRRSLDRAEG